MKQIRIQILLIENAIHVFPVRPGTYKTDDKDKLLTECLSYGPCISETVYILQHYDNHAWSNQGYFEVKEAKPSMRLEVHSDGANKANFLEQWWSQ